MRNAAGGHLDEPVTVVGAGPVGCLLSILLARRGHEVVVYERGPDPRGAPAPAGRSINLTLAERGWTALARAGVDGAVREITMPMRGRMIHGEQGSLRFQPYTSDGDAIYSASRWELTARLLEIARTYDAVTFRFDHRCQDVDLARRTVWFEGPDGVVEDVRPSRVLAADGAFSMARHSLARAGASFFQRLSPLMYKELRVPCDSSGACFAMDALHLWPRGDCMIVGFPNPDRSLTASVFMPAQGDVSFGAFTGVDELERYLAAVCPDLLARAPDLLQDFFARPPSSLFSSGCSTWIHEDWLALVGDAAHALVPFLGQGLNAGFEDCSVLADCIDALGDDWTAVFAGYERLRRPDCDAVIELAEQHFDELARRARDPRFVVRKALEERAHLMDPERFTPLYTMVAFSHRRYADIRRVQARQEEMLDRLMALPQIDDAWDGADVERAIRSELARL